MTDSDPPRRLDTDLVVAGAAILISLCALVVSFYETRIMREHQRAAVWPYVEFGPSFSDEGFALRTWNQGVGPARIRSMQVRVDGAPMRTWAEMLTALGVADSLIGNDRTNGRVLPPQSEMRSMYVPGAERANRIGEAILGEDGRLTIALCYCSVYDECWRLTVRGLEDERTPVAACEVNPSEEFKR